MHSRGTQRREHSHEVIIPRVLLLGVFILITPAYAQPGTLQVGAARIDITPAPDADLPMSGYAGRQDGFKGILDLLFEENPRNVHAGQCKVRPPAAATTAVSACVGLVLVAPSDGAGGSRHHA